uniref:Uncharacterized protein n=1 Tax=Mycena chlorophos TaxID=658473 RepID=A0ABQ0M9L2_MYCCL|nr:predicted protein [Mycena chlorophos]
MGRALFSERYGIRASSVNTTASAGIPAPVASLPVDPTPVSYEKWSLTNRFDPDCDEFFATAEYEAFLDRGDVDLAEHPVSGSEDNVSNTGSSESGRDTPEQDPVMSTVSVSVPVAVIANNETPVPVPIIDMAMVIDNDEDDAEPRTPPPMAHLELTPSPPPTVTPRIYVWNRVGLPTSPASPNHGLSLRRTHPIAAHAHITPRRLVGNA